MVLPGEYSQELQTHLANLAAKIDGEEDLLPHLERVPQYAQQLQGPLVHLRRRERRQILHWFSGERNRVVDLIAPAAAIFGISPSAVRRYVRSVERPTARSVESGADPFGIFLPDFEAAVRDALAQVGDPPSELDKANLQAILPNAVCEPKRWKPPGAPFSRSSQFPHSDVKLLRERIEEKRQNARQRVVWNNTEWRYTVECQTFEQLKHEFQSEAMASACWHNDCFRLEEKWLEDGELCTEAEALVRWVQDPRYYNHSQRDWDALVRWWDRIKSCSPQKRMRQLPDDERDKVKDALRSVLLVSETS